MTRDNNARREGRALSREMTDAGRDSTIASAPMFLHCGACSRAGRSDQIDGAVQLPALVTVQCSCGTRLATFTPENLESKVSNAFASGCGCDCCTSGVKA